MQLPISSMVNFHFYFLTHFFFFGKLNNPSSRSGFYQYQDYEGWVDITHSVEDSSSIKKMGWKWTTNTWKHDTPPKKWRRQKMTFSFYDWYIYRLNHFSNRPLVLLFFSECTVSMKILFLRVELYSCQRFLHDQSWLIVSVFYVTQANELMVVWWSLQIMLMTWS